MKRERLITDEFSEDTFPFEGVLAVLAIALTAFAAVYISPKVALVILLGIVVAFGFDLLLQYLKERGEKAPVPTRQSQRV